MAGRHGGDQLGIALMCLCTLLLICSYVFQQDIFATLAFLVLVYCTYRVLSRKINKRYQENAMFLKAYRKCKTFFLNLGASLSFRKEKRLYRYFACPRCVQRIRVPKGKGTLRITCPKCGEVFEKKT